MKREFEASFDWYPPKSVLKAALAHPVNFAACLLSYRWIRFLLVGGAATLTYYISGLLFVNWLKLPILVGNSLAYALGFVVSYLGQARWSFHATMSHAVMLPKFAATQGIGFVLNALIIEVCLHLHVPYAVAMLIAIAILPFITYLLLKLWVFRSNSPQ